MEPTREGELPVVWTCGHLLGLRQLAAGTLTYATLRKDLFPDARPGKARILSRPAKEDLWHLWQRVLDCVLALEQVSVAHSDWKRTREPDRRSALFLMHVAAFQAQYRTALEFIELVERDPCLDPVLNDSVPEMGLPPRTYEAFKARFLNIGMGTHFALLRAAAAAFEGKNEPELRSAIAEDSEFLWAHGRVDGTLHTAKNAIHVLQKTALSAWQPVQRQASITLGHMRLPVREGWFVRTEELAQVLPVLMPGDVILQRREWAFTNLGLPGFWTHAALFIGTRAEREALASDPGVRAWLEGHRGGADLEQLLAARYLDRYPLSLVCGDGHPVRIIEALGPGVLFNSLERSCACDGLAVLRPRLPAPAKAEAILKAFRFVGRPYDFAFDYSTDSALVCSELVLKSYEASDELPGLSLPVATIAGHRVTPANSFALAFDRERGHAERQFDLVVFLDGQEWQHRAMEADESEFRRSARRPKWHIFL